jgi:carbonic anhydrase
VAGNIVNEDILGSMEYACKVAGSKIVVVMGHTNCGAVTAACNHIELGNVTPLLSKIQYAVGIAENEENWTVSQENIERVSELNVHHSIDRIRKESKILAEMEANGEIEIVGAMYSVQTGEVTFY